MAEKQRKINMNIVDGKLFFSDEITVIHNPTKFFLDFKNNSPRIDVRFSQGLQPMVIEHNVVTMDPFTAKQLMTTLQDNIVKYEKQFGPIEKPEQITQAEEKIKKQQKATPVSTTQHPPSYLG